MRSYGLWLLDLDGTMYRGSEKIEAAPIFIDQLKEEQAQIMFLTNNSSKSPAEVVQHLRAMDIAAEEDQVMTSSMVTADYLASQKPQARVYMIGEEGLRLALLNKGCQLVEADEPWSTCDFVVIGIDRDVSYSKLARATQAVYQGATFVATNADKALPTEHGLMPGNGSIVSVVHLATGVEPIFMGKPEIHMIHRALKMKGFHANQAIMVGDNYETDIRAGLAAGIDTALVFSGYTKREQLEQIEDKPTYQWENLVDGLLSMKRS